MVTFREILSTFIFRKQNFIIYFRFQAINRLSRPCLGSIGPRKRNINRMGLEFLSFEIECRVSKCANVHPHVLVFVFLLGSPSRGFTCTRLHMWVCSHVVSRATSLHLGAAKHASYFLIAALVWSIEVESYLIGLVMRVFLCIHALCAHAYVCACTCICMAVHL